MAVFPLFCLRHCVRSGLIAIQPWVKATEREADHTLPVSLKRKRHWRCTSTLQYSFPGVVIS